MAKCWEQRGCDEEMQGECPHAVEYFDNCPTKCAFAACDRPTYELTIDPALIFSPDVDRSPDDQGRLHLLRVLPAQRAAHAGGVTGGRGRLDVVSRGRNSGAAAIVLPETVFQEA